MKQKIKIFLCIASICSLYGCCSDVTLVEIPENTGPVSLTAHTKGIRTQTKDLTLEAKATVRNGAAYEEGSYIHVLSYDPKYADKESPIMHENVKYDRAMYGNHYVKQNALKRAHKSGYTGSDDVDGAKTDLADNVNGSYGSVEEKITMRKPFEPYNAPYYGVFEYLEDGSIEDYSMYELSRWERFCNNGERMDKKDWHFVKEHKDAFPYEFKVKCIPPSHKDLIRNNFFED